MTATGPCLDPGSAAMTPALNHSYASLPEQFYARLHPAAMPEPKLVHLNTALAEELGLDPDWLATAEGVAFLTGSRLPERAQPLAMAYAGHQFGVFVPQLGDGRAILLGEIVDRNEISRDLHLKGAGRTPFSRAGDGRAVLGPVLREYIVSEAMAALGIPTTRSLAALTTGETVRRERPLPGAILARVARSHVRVGTFQYFAARGDVGSIRLLADHVIGRHYPEAAEDGRPYHKLLDAVIAGQAALVARWMLVGFIHGVMNTDNMSVAGETIDYGPCAFMDAYDPATVFSSIDHHGRYAYGNQPAVAQWNLCRFAETLLPLLDKDQDAAVAQAQSAIEAFPGLHDKAWLDGMRTKLGLTMAHNGDRVLAEDLLGLMAANGADFTLTFRTLGILIAPNTKPQPGRQPRDLFRDPAAFDAWAARWRQRLAQEDVEPSQRLALMEAANPAYIPRNHRVEAALAAAVDVGDLVPFDKLMAVLAQPFEDRAALAEYMNPPAPEEAVCQTFCGT